MAHKVVRNCGWGNRSWGPGQTLPAGLPKDVLDVLVARGAVVEEGERAEAPAAVAAEAPAAPAAPEAPAEPGFDELPGHGAEPKGKKRGK